jgi:uncharacterized coiled-coil protein SlyX
MHGETPLSHEVWEHIPPEVQAYIRALEVRVGTLEKTVQALKAAMQQVEATVHQLREQLQHNSRTSSRPPSSDPPRRWVNVPTVSLVDGAPAGNSVMRDRRGRCGQSRRSMSSSRSSLSAVPAANRHCWERIPSLSGIR